MRVPMFACVWPVHASLCSVGGGGAAAGAGGKVDYVGPTNDQFLSQVESDTDAAEASLRNALRMGQEADDVASGTLESMAHQREQIAGVHTKVSAARLRRERASKNQGSFARVWRGWIWPWAVRTVHRLSLYFCLHASFLNNHR